MKIENTKKANNKNSHLNKSKEALMNEFVVRCKKIDDNDDFIRKNDSELYKAILYNLEVRKVYLDPSLNLKKLSHLVGTNTTYLSNAINNYFKCNLKNLINSYRVEYAKYLLDKYDEPIVNLPRKCGFTSRSVFYVAFKKEVGISPLQYVAVDNDNVMSLR